MNKKDIVLISECISVPFDEGLKNVLFNIMSSLQKNDNVAIMTSIDNKTDGLDIEKIKLNKMFLNIRLVSVLKKLSPKIILYVPEASCTFNSFIRAKVLKLMCRHSIVVMLGAQYRTYSAVQAFMIFAFLRPGLLLLLSRQNEAYYKSKGINVKVLPPAVDSKKFLPPNEEEKKTIRCKYNIPQDKKIILHVGHIKVDRNIECLLEVQKLEGIQVVIVGSTSFAVENDLKAILLEAGIYVIDEFIPDISEVYKMSDVYVFPVMSNVDAIDMPLSVLEAMACNLPVITTHFGGLTESFVEDKGFKYFGLVSELLKLIQDIELTGIKNAEKVAYFSWDSLTREILDAIGALECQKAH